jgi:hypothetical protein
MQVQESCGELAHADPGNPVSAKSFANRNKNPSFYPS